jgi:hypothetical protein
LNIERFTATVAWNIALIFLFAGISYGDFTGKGHVHTLSETKQVFSNTDCRSTDTCDLRRFTLTKVVNEIWLSDDPHYPTYGNGVIMEYETDALAALEKYVIVQFKKGCVFDSSKTRNGKIDRRVGDLISSFGEDIPYCFPQWVIDSQDTDPAYNSDPEHGRFYLLRWNKPGSYDYRTQKYYGAEKPEKPIVYMVDYPAGAFVRALGVRNVALEFKTCIYRARDVPAKTRRDDIAFGKPLSCFEWQNVYIYDFDKAGFQTDLAQAPRWDEPAPRLTPYILATVAILMMTLALILFLRSAKTRGRRDR